MEEFMLHEFLLAEWIKARYIASITEEQINCFVEERAKADLDDDKDFTRVHIEMIRTG